jgi:hypothetical protein
MFYFQSRYFKHNVEKAVEKEISLFNPACRFNIPQFAMLPLKTFEKMTDAKKSLTLSLQIDSLEGTQFANELRFLRIIHSISDFILSKSLEEETAEKNLKYFFGAFYIKCRTEFLKKYPVKNIDWDTKASKLIHTLPKWRKTDDPTPPSTNSNRYATDLINRVKSGKLKISGQEAKDEFENLAKVEKPQNPKPTSSEKKRHPQSSSSNNNFNNRKVVKAKRLNGNPNNHQKHPKHRQPPPAPPSLDLQQAANLIN